MRTFLIRNYKDVRKNNWVELSELRAGSGIQTHVRVHGVFRGTDQLNTYVANLLGVDQKVGSDYIKYSVSAPSVSGSEDAVRIFAVRESND